MGQDAIRDWKRGDSFSASHLNEVVDVARRLSLLIGDGDVQSLSSRNSTALGRKRNYPNTIDIRIAQLVGTGPASAPDFTDSRYWANPVMVLAGWEQDLPVFEDNPPEPNAGETYPLPVTNLAEWLAGTHTLNVTGATNATRPPYLIFGMYDINRLKRWFMTAGGGSVLPRGLKYQVLAVIDDASTWAADDPRFR